VTLWTTEEISMEVVQPLVTYKHQYYTHTYIVTLTSTSKIVHWVMRYILTVTFGLFSNFILELLAVKGQANMMGWNGALSGKGSIIFPPLTYSCIKTKTSKYLQQSCIQINPNTTSYFGDWQTLTSQLKAKSSWKHFTEKTSQAQFTTCFFAI